MTEETRDELGKILRSILISSPTNMTADDVAHVYRELMFTNIPYLSLGYKKVEDLLLDFPEVVQPIKMMRGKFLYRGVPDDKTRAISNVIAKQAGSRKSKPKQQARLTANVSSVYAREKIQPLNHKNFSSTAISKSSSNKNSYYIDSSKIRHIENRINIRRSSLSTSHKFIPLQNKITDNCYQSKKNIPWFPKVREKIKINEIQSRNCVKDYKSYQDEFRLSDEKTKLNFSLKNNILTNIPNNENNNVIDQSSRFRNNFFYEESPRIKLFSESSKWYDWINIESSLNNDINNNLNNKINLQSYREYSSKEKSSDNTQQKNILSAKFEKNDYPMAINKSFLKEDSSQILSQNNLKMNNLKLTLEERNVNLQSSKILSTNIVTNNDTKSLFPFQNSQNNITDNYSHNNQRIKNKPIYDLKTKNNEFKVQNIDSYVQNAPEIDEISNMMIEMNISQYSNINVKDQIVILRDRCIEILKKFPKGVPLSIFIAEYTEKYNDVFDPKIFGVSSIPELIQLHTFDLLEIDYNLKSCDPVIRRRISSKRLYKSIR